MNILITNDDGITSKGIIALAARFKEMGDVVVVAPNKQMSATSHSITTVSPIRVQKFDMDNNFFGYSVTGTPADCVKLAINSLLKSKPDIILSGINHGRNTGINIMYSGTVAGAAEGHLLGIPSFAISLSSHNEELECDTAADYAFKIVSEVLKNNDTKGLFLNINIPATESSKIKGIKIVRSSNSYWEDEFDKRIDPFGRPYYWFNGSYIYDTNDENIDDVVLDNGYVAVTPLQFSFTNLNQLEDFKCLENILESNIEEGVSDNQNNEPNNELPETKDEKTDVSSNFELADAEIEKVLADREISNNQPQDIQEEIEE